MYNNYCVFFQKNYFYQSFNITIYYIKKTKSVKKNFFSKKFSSNKYDNSVFLLF